MKYNYQLIKNSLHSKESWFNVLVLKHITIPLVYVMVNYTKITPNIISLFSLLFGLLSAYFYFKGALLLGGLMYLISYIFDATDGKVARITKTGKPYGAWLDISIDRINLVLISTAISYNYFLNANSVNLIFLNSLFLGLVFIGSESRYHIDFYKLKNKIKETENIKKLSNYEKWCDKKGLIKHPISLPELFIFYLIIAPNFNIQYTTLLVITFFLIVRIMLQQFFWIHVTKNK